MLYYQNQLAKNNGIYKTECMIYCIMAYTECVCERDTKQTKQIFLTMGMYLSQQM